VLRGMVGVVIAIRAWENDDSEFHRGAVCSVQRA